jgi:hypothetical protein
MVTVTRAIRGLGNVPEEVADPIAHGYLEEMRAYVLALKKGQDETAAIAAAAAANAGSGGTPAPAPSPSPTPPAPPPAPDLTPPPTPTGVLVVAGLDFIGITTDAPIFSVGHGYGRTIVYGAKYPGTGPLPTFLDAVVVHEFVGQVGSFPTEPATQWHIWVKWRTFDGIESTAPSGGANGHQATTGQDISSLLEVLTGSITTSELHAALNARIDLVDGMGPGSVNERITISEDGLQAQISVLGISVGDNSAAIANEAVVRASADGFISAYYGLRTQVSQGGRTVVGGIGIMGTSGGSAGPTIDVGVVANKFYVTAPTGTTGVSDVLPFVIQTTPETINGVVIPAGVYMDAAYIKNLQAITARLGNLWVTNAMMANVSADKLIAGSIAVGQHIQSSDFVTGLSGWRLGGNTAEIGSTAIRGLLTAAQIDTRGLTIKDAAGTVVFSANTPLTQAYADAALHNDRVPTGSNLVYNSAFEAGLDGWDNWIGANLYTGTTGVNFDPTWRLLPATDPWTSVFYIQQLGGSTDPNGYNERGSKNIPVTAGKRYVVSGYLQMHRAIGVVFVRFFNAAGAILLDGAAWSPQGDNQGANGNTLGMYARVSNSVVAPVGAVYAHVCIRKYATIAPDTSSYLFATRIQLQEVADNTTTPSAWADSPRQHFITPTNVSTYIANVAIKSAQIDTVVANQITSGSFTGKTFDGGTFTGSVFQTSASAGSQRVIINESGSNEARFYGNRGDGTIELLASIGINTVGSDVVVGNFGNLNAGNSRVALLGRSYSDYGVLGFSQTATGVYGGSNGALPGLVGENFGSGYGVDGLGVAGGVRGSVLSGSGRGVYGLSQGSGPGVEGTSALGTGYGAIFTGNATRPPLLLTAQSTPAGGHNGAMYVDGAGRLWVSNGAAWQEVQYVGGGGPVTCFPAGALVLMADGTQRRIEFVLEGSMVWTPMGARRVVKVDRPRLGNRRMLGFMEDSHTWSEEHAHWTRQGGAQWWWSANPALWRSEVEQGAIGGLLDNDSMRGGDEVEFAHTSGWVQRSICVVDANPNTLLYLPMTEGEPIVVNGYLVGAGVNERGCDYTALDWDAALSATRFNDGP